MYDFLIWLQGFENPFLTGFFSLVSDIIAPLPLSVIAVIIYWCISKKRGIALALSVISAVTVNTGLKLIFRVPRPFNVNEGIKRMDDTDGFSFPSGHSQQAGTFAYFTVSAVKRKTLGIILGILLILSVTLSRMYLGMHTPLDVTVGVILGLMITPAVVFFTKEADEKKKTYILHAVTLISAILMVFTDFHKDFVSMTGLSFGAVTGYMIDEKYIFYRVPEKTKHKIIAGITGLITIGVVKLLFAIIPLENWYIRLLDYGTFGFAVTAIAPYLIKKIIKEGE